MSHAPHHAPTALRTLDPTLPEPLAKLTAIAANFWWSWNPEAMDLFRRVDADLWRSTGHNPIATLARVERPRLAALATDAVFTADVARVYDRLRAELTTPGRFDPRRQGGDSAERPPEGFRVAYFCAEFGLAECFQIYCGGLGLLAGDHLKSASELGLPLVAVGLLYARGYFHQEIDAEGWQHERMPDLEPGQQAVLPVLDPKTGRQMRVRVQLPGRDVAVAVWRADVGSVPLYLLDTNLPENSPEDRAITDNLYLGDHHHRVKQEIVLGIGGVRALEALGEKITVFHMNEGHAGFLALERIARYREAHPGISFDEAREAAAPAHVFTTHTPLPAGIDRFHPSLVAPYFEGMLGRLGLDAEGFLALGRERVEDKTEMFSMAVLAIRCSRFCNGVSALHGRVSRSMWRRIWPATPVHDVPIGHVTNGVHMRSWLSPEIAALYRERLGERILAHPDDPSSWQGVESIPDADLWKAHTAGKARLITFVRDRLREQFRRQSRNESDAGAVLRPDVFTIGFARRFAAYKRGTLLFRDRDRFARILASGRPLQIIIAGKAHPGDHGGKQMIHDIIDFARREGVWDRVVFLEDYDIGIARAMVQGVDMWLNNPIRGLEASGTSGMKAALNGVPNASILDGWWDEAYEAGVGYAIGGRETTPDTDADLRDRTESAALYTLLEDQILPDFYAQDAAGLPSRWIATMKRCIRTLGPKFTTHRMVAQYAQMMYYPAHRHATRLAAEELAPARSLAQRIEAYRSAWRDLRVESAQLVPPANGAGSACVHADVRLGPLAPRDVDVQLFSEHEVPIDNGPPGTPVGLRHEGEIAPGMHRFVKCFAPSADIPWRNRSLGVRVLPKDERLVTPFIPGLIATSPVTLPGGDFGDEVGGEALRA